MTSGASAPSTSLSGAERRRRERELLTELADLEPGDPLRATVRDELVTMHLPLVQHLARRYRDRGESVDDLVQVGTVGLIKAVDRFDLSRDVEFSTYATPTILGEIKRHFRDRTLGRAGAPADAGAAGPGRPPGATSSRARSTGPRRCASWLRRST